LLLNSLFYKIWADLWLYKARTLLAVLSIFVGVVCVGALFGLIDLELSTMDAAHRAAKPSHISMILRADADNSLLPKIKAIAGVKDIDALTPLTVRYRLLDKSEWQIGTLVFRPPTAQQKYDLTTSPSNNWPTGEEIAIERLSADYTHQKIGDSVAFETVNVSIITQN